jgi:hypothetical protein
MKHSIPSTPWTNKHEEYCFENKLPPICRILWQWLLREGRVGTEIEPDLSEFNEWVSQSRGKKYSHQYLKKAFDLLLDRRVIQIIKPFCWKINRILVRPIDWLKPLKKCPKKNLQSYNQSYNSQPSNPTSADEGDYSSSILNSSEQAYIEEEQQRQHEILTLCAEHEIFFNPEKQPEVLTYDVEDVRCALEHYKRRGGGKFDCFGNPKILNPQGWLINCLRNGYWEDEDFGIDDFLQLMKSFVTPRPK